MTSTTKEQRADLLRLLAYSTCAPWCVDARNPERVIHRVDTLAHIGVCESLHTYRDGDLIVAMRNALPALLTDSERLSAIEAVTGEEASGYALGLRARGFGAEADLLLSLSAKVAEQAEEIERLKGQEASWREVAMTNGEQWDASHVRAEASEAKCKELEFNAAVNNGERIAQARNFRDLKAERDTLRRLLTETAVPALERIERRDFLMADLKSVTTPERVASSALSTISAQMENSTAAPQPARCSTCDDTRIIYGHGGVESSCPACHGADAGAGLAMLGGDGRG